MEDDQDGAVCGLHLVRRVWESWTYLAWSRDGFGAS